MSVIKVTISLNAECILEQLFLFGPVHDSDLVEKSGRDELRSLGALERVMGYNTLNAEGVAMAVERKLHFRKGRLKKGFVPAVSGTSGYSGLDGVLHEPST